MLGSVTEGHDYRSQSVRFDLIIFDCDGVLIDSEPIVNRTPGRGSKRALVAA